METIKQCEVCGSTKRVSGRSGKFKMDLCEKHRRHMIKYGRIMEDKNKIVIIGDIVEITILNRKGEYLCTATVNSRHINEVIKHKWCISNGYVMCKINNKTIKLHRLITNAPKGTDVDHINHNTLDNTDKNLRVCSHQNNNRNMSVSSRNKTGITGVSWCKERSKWAAYISIGHKIISLGRFKDIDDAIVARKEAEIKYFGEFSYTG